MAYAKQTWNQGAAGGTPLNAPRLNHVEDGIEAAALTADNAEPGRAVVSQAEAEAGTATTVRGWTAQRVAQAVAAVAPAITGALGVRTWDSTSSTWSARPDFDVVLAITIDPSATEPTGAQDDDLFIQVT